MPKFDLNLAKDFARATSSASSVLNLLTGLAADEWNVDESAFGRDGDFVLFHVFKSSVDYDGAVAQVSDSGGRRKVPFSFPYQDGQTTDDLGRMGESFDFDVLLFGKNYKRAYDQLIEKFNDPRPGDLVHPIRGRIRVAVKDWTVTHSHEKRQAVALRVRFIEHNFDVSFNPTAEGKPSTLKSAISAAIGVFNTISNIINKVESNIFTARSLKTAIKTALEDYKAGYSTTLTNLNRTFNRGTSTDVPLLLPTQSGDNFPLAGSQENVLQDIPDTALDSQTSAALASQQAIDDVVANRNQLNSVISLMSEGEGSLLYYDEINDLKRAAVSLQNVLELGLQNSKTRIKNYAVPRNMSLREVCFENDLSVDSVYDLEVLNPWIQTTNEIEKGTILKVPN